jgi:hypothetical protein
MMKQAYDVLFIQLHLDIEFKDKITINMLEKEIPVYKILAMQQIKDDKELQSTNCFSLSQRVKVSILFSSRLTSKDCIR